MPKAITLAGATGRFRALAPSLLEHGHRVRVVTRDVASPTARELRGAGAEIFPGDFDREESLVAALEGAEAFLAAGTAHRAGPAGETRHGIGAANAAAASGVGHFVYISGSGASADTDVPVFAAKHAVESHIRSLALPFTIVAPVYFMENLFNPWNLPALRAGVFPSPVAADRLVQQVAIRDVISFARLVLERPAEHRHARVEIASAEITGGDAARTLSRVLGCEFAFERLDTSRLPAGLARLFDWLDRKGDQVDVAALHARYPEVGWLSFQTWAEHQDWRQLVPACLAS